MKVPITWLREFVDIELPIPELAHRLTLAGLEVEEIRFVGLPLPEGKNRGPYRSQAEHRDECYRLGMGSREIRRRCSVRSHASSRRRPLGAVPVG